MFSIFYVCFLYFFCFFFFFKQKTAYEVRISDWSSDVCSSDLANAEPLGEFCRDPEVGTAFTLACDHSGAELNQALRFLPDLEADPQAFALPSRVDRKQIVGGVGGDRKSTRLNSSQ